MNQRRSVKTNLIANWLNHGVSLLIGVFLMPYVLHILGDAQYGSWIFINAIAGYSGLLYLGFGQTISRYVAHYHAKQDWTRLNHVSNVIFAIYLGMGFLAILTAGILAWLAPHLSDWGAISLFEIRLVILILGLNVFVGLAGSVFGGVLMGIQRFDIERGVNLTGGIMRLILTILFLKAEWGLLTIAIIFFAITLFENLGNLFFAFRQVKTFRIGPKYLNWAILKECGSFSGFAFIDAIAWTLIEATDSILIGIFFSPAVIVPYYIALRLTQFINMPIAQIGKVFMPRAGELHANDDHHALQKLVLNGVSLSFLLVTGFFIGVCFFGNNLITTWIGPGYPQSQLILMILLGARIVALPVSTFRSVLYGMGNVKIPSLIYMGEAVTNLILSVILIQSLGLVGVALGTAIPILIAELGIILPYAMKKLNITAGQLLRTAIRPTLAPLLVLLGYSYYIPHFFEIRNSWLTLVSVATGGGVFLIGTWFVFEKGNIFLNRSVSNSLNT
ncbi:oligosaccharide flippase family protein [Gimesia fumaroli]|uniref:Polysaccharide biosynthesis protein n=1 Tax=Gimesia fumaroli TaxID=2527976 RepID=A0A518IDS2_9PLAN|nr:oligosaccharide flippase family protein [Gimesia fumaroli]QDV51234.1 Polysaccharide biosynthesis protein [Gimesia fumaroli]